MLDVPYIEVVTGVGILIVGLGFHWLGQLVSLVAPERAKKLGLLEPDLPAEYTVYEHAIAVADVAIGWAYGLAAIGLLMGAHWGYQLAFVPGAIFVYHGISAWVWEGNRRAAGRAFFSDAMRIGWCTANVGVGLLALAVAWAGTAA